MTMTLLPLGQALGGLNRASKRCVIVHAGATVVVSQLAYLVWHACQLDPQQATEGFATARTLHMIVANALQTSGVGPVRDLDPYDGLEELREAGLIAELNVLRHPAARHTIRPGTRPTWTFFETIKLIPTGEDRGEADGHPQAQLIKGRRSEATIPAAAAAVWIASTGMPWIGAAVAEAAIQRRTSGRDEYTQTIAFLPLLVGIGAARLEATTPPAATSQRWAQACAHLGITPQDSRRDCTG